MSSANDVQRLIETLQTVHLVLGLKQQHFSKVLSFDLNPRKEGYSSLEARDVVIQNLSALFLTEEILREEPELHDHVGEAGGDLLLEEEVGVGVVMRLPVIQQLLDRYWSWCVPWTSEIRP